MDPEEVERTARQIENDEPLDELPMAPDSEALVDARLQIEAYNLRTIKAISEYLSSAIGTAGEDRDPDRPFSQQADVDDDVDVVSARTLYLVETYRSMRAARARATRIFQSDLDWKRD
jgi:hypothetical protein